MESLTVLQINEWLVWKPIQPANMRLFQLNRHPPHRTFTTPNIHHTEIQKISLHIYGKSAMKNSETRARGWGGLRPFGVFPEIHPFIRWSCYHRWPVGLNFILCCFPQNYVQLPTKCRLQIIAAEVKSHTLPTCNYNGYSIWPPTVLGPVPCTGCIAHGGV